MYQPIFHMWNPNSTEKDECYQRALCGTLLPFDGKHNLTVWQHKVTCKKCLAIIKKQEEIRG